MNRILAAIGRTEQRILDRGLTGDKLAALGSSLDMAFDEYCRFQEFKSLAYADGTLNLDEANFIYSSIGESVDTFNRLPVAYKVVFTQLFSELLKRAIKTYA